MQAPIAGQIQDPIANGSLPEAAATRRGSWTKYRPIQRWGFLAVLFLVSASQFFDRHVISVLLEPIKVEFQVSDTMLGLLGGFCFALFYAVAGIPVARWADRGNRRTVITVALTIWSVMTVFCGMAQTFWQLALARIGVGIGESGGLPPAQSLIVDYFPPERRASAIAIFTGGAVAGSVLGLGVGGLVAASEGWRSAFLVAGAPGVLLALLVRFTLDEPRVAGAGSGVRVEDETIRETLARLCKKKSYMTALLACILYYTFAYGPLLFIPSFLIRVLHTPLAKAGTSYALVVAVASLIGTVGGGWLADRLAKRDIRWLAWLPALAFGTAAPIYLAAFVSDNLGVFMILAFSGIVLLSAGLPSAFTAVHAICGNARRAVAFAVIYFLASLVGGGFGPLVSGAISDALAAVYGANGLRYALIIMIGSLVSSSAVFFQFGRQMLHDVEE